MNIRFCLSVMCSVLMVGSAAAQTALQPRGMDNHGADAAGNWLVDSAALDPDDAQAEGEIQSGLGNCRLIAAGGATPEIVEGGPEDAKHGLIIVVDADGSDTAAADAAADIAEAYGELYNEAVGNTCGF